MLCVQILKKTPFFYPIRKIYFSIKGVETPIPNNLNGELESKILMRDIACVIESAQQSDHIIYLKRR